MTPDIIYVVSSHLLYDKAWRGILTDALIKVKVKLTFPVCRVAVIGGHLENVVDEIKAVLGVHFAHSILEGTGYIHIFGFIQQTCTPIITF